MTSSALPKLRFIYADLIFWRAECIRMALEFGNVPFADARLSRDEIKQLKEEVSVTITRFFNCGSCARLFDGVL